MTELDNLKAEVHRANLELVRHGLVLFTWGNASALDRSAGLVVIKPSGVPYDTMRPEDMVLVELETGKVINQKFKPSSDTPTHLELYRRFPGVAGIVHTHSKHATAWAQAGRDLPCLGTTHADDFFGAVPCTPPMTEAEIQDAYEQQTAVVIARTFQERQLDPLAVPGVLVHSHAPFTWGKTLGDAVHKAVVLESVAEMALLTLALNPDAQAISPVLLNKHHSRKNGKGAYYGQG